MSKAWLADIGIQALLPLDQPRGRGRPDYSSEKVLESNRKTRRQRGRDPWNGTPSTSSSPSTRRTRASRCCSKPPPSTYLATAAASSASPPSASARTFGLHAHGHHRRADGFESRLDSGAGLPTTFGPGTWTPASSTDNDVNCNIRYCDFYLSKVAPGLCLKNCRRPKG